MVMNMSKTLIDNRHLMAMCKLGLEDKIDQIVIGKNGLIKFVSDGYTSMLKVKTPYLFSRDWVLHQNEVYEFAKNQNSIITTIKLDKNKVNIIGDDGSMMNYTDEVPERQIKIPMLDYKKRIYTTVEELYDRITSIDKVSDFFRFNHEDNEWTMLAMVNGVRLSYPIEVLEIGEKEDFEGCSYSTWLYKEILTKLRRVKRILKSNSVLTIDFSHDFPCRLLQKTSLGDINILIAPRISRDEEE